MFKITFFYKVYFKHTFKFIENVVVKIESLKGITLSRERTRHIVDIDHRESEEASSALANFNLTFKIRKY